MKQQTLAMAGDQNAQHEQFRRPTRRDAFLVTMERIVPWKALCGVIEPHYPKPGNGRPLVGLERMLRMYFVQHWFNLADVACEDALLDSTALRLRCHRPRSLAGARCDDAVEVPATAGQARSRRCSFWEGRRRAAGQWPEGLTLPRFHVHQEVGNFGCMENRNAR